MRFFCSPVSLSPTALVLIAMFGLACDRAIAAAATPPPLEHFLERDAFVDVKISPDGRHLAASVPVERGSALVMLNTETGEKQGHFYAGKELEIDDFWWASNDRLLIAAAQRFLGDEAPTPTGEIFATDVDGGRSTPLIGYRAGQRSTGTHLKVRESERVWASPIAILPDSEGVALVQVEPMLSRSTLPATIERLDIEHGRRVKVATSPVIRARFLTDAEGNLRFAQGRNVNNELELHHRGPGEEEWTLINHEGQTGQELFAWGFSPDGRGVYLQASREDGPDAVELMDLASGERTEVYRHQRHDPVGPILSLDGDSVIGVRERNPLPGVHFFDPEHPEALLWRSLLTAFEGHEVAVTSATADGSVAVVFVRSDRNPGEYFLFDRESKHARHFGSRGAKLDPEQMASTRAVQFRTRDGLAMDGWLTLPPGAAAKDLPLVVHPHGGPFGVQDIWGFSPGLQILATRGFAVLQVNFRGSGGYGKDFVLAGYKQWGRAMQDDLTDATRWAIEEGIADARRICIYGASYGGYASLMGVAREPDLYACAAGDVGVYDLETWTQRVDFQDLRWGRNYLRDAVGTEGLQEVSPVHLAASIKVPVFLAAGENDRRAPVQQTERMEDALERAEVPVQSLYFRGEGHGYYSTDNKLKFYSELIAFFDQHIGSGWEPVEAAPSGP